MGIKLIEILLVEDNEGDIELTKEAFSESKMKNNLFVVKDGVEALKFLRKEADLAGSPTPDLVLLDLNLPKKDGREVLAEIKNDDKLKMIPVVILTTSDADEDIMRSYGSHANCYIKKPVDFDKFVDVVKGIEQFWFSVVKLPHIQ